MHEQFGILNIDKPSGLTSREIVNRVQQVIRPAKCGHAGTLDPLATGVLVVCTGPATRLIQFVQRQTKRYVARFRLGVHSDTDDITGNLQSVKLTRSVLLNDIENLLPDFIGEIEQIPPRFSAVHVNGRRAYDLARRGADFELESRTVEVHEIKLTVFDPPEFELAITCGSGTYIRSIGRDIGERLGTAAVMTALVRTRVGPFLQSEAMDSDSISSESISKGLLPARLAVAGNPEFLATEADSLKIIQGKPIDVPADARVGLKQVRGEVQQRLTAVIGPDESLWALAEYDARRKCLKPRHVFLRDKSVDKQG